MDCVTCRTTCGTLNRTRVPWRLRHRLTLRDLAEMFLVRGIDVVPCKAIYFNTLSGTIVLDAY